MTRVPWLTQKRLDTDERSARRVLRVGRVMISLVTLILVLLVVRVWMLETNPPPRIAALMNSQSSDMHIDGRRGQIIARRGRILAVTHIAHLLFVDPTLITRHDTFAERVGYNLDLIPAHISKLIYTHPTSRFVVLDRRLTDAQYAKFQTLHLPGLATKSIMVRNYPQGALAGQVVGFVGRDGKGLAGLELDFQHRLAARPGQFDFLRDARRRALWVQPGSYQPNEDGQDIRLSLDMTIQAIAHAALDKAVTHFHAKSGQIIVIRPDTGEILAMANDPSFNPNDLATSTAAQRRNRCVTDIFEPGSIFKPVVWSLLTELGAAKPDEIINCDNGVYHTDFGRTLRDAEPIGKVSWAEVLVHSSNIGMAKVAQRMSIPTLYHIVKAFGFGDKTGSGLPGEVTGLVNPLSRWNQYSQTSIPMGQEIGVTALQMVRAYCVFSNGGFLVTPRITPTGPAAPAPGGDYPGGDAVIKQRILSPAVALLTRQVLRRVVTEGTGRHAQSDLYQIYGKTGTAQLPDHIHGGYYQHRYVSSFIGGAPLDNPRIIVGCFIQQPDPKIGHYGAVVSAPAVKTVIEQTLQYLGVPTFVKRE